MRLLKKQLLVFSINLLVFVGLASTISGYTTSYFEGKAFSTDTLTLDRSIYTIGGVPTSSSYFDFNWTKNDSSSIGISGLGSFPKNADNTTFLQIRQNVSTQPGDIGSNFRGFWNTSATPGYITNITITPLASTSPSTGTARSIAPILSANQSIGTITSLDGNNATNAPSFAEKAVAQNIMGSTTVATPVSWDFSPNKMYRYFNITPNSSHTHYYTSVVITYSTPQTDNEATETFAENFMSYTSDKNSACTESGLNWVNLGSNFNTLTSNQKALFTSGSNNQTISSAVERYLYLRTFNNTLTNFANL